MHGTFLAAVYGDHVTCDVTARGKDVRESAVAGVKYRYPGNGI